jgi:hypothetical protein
MMERMTDDMVQFLRDRLDDDEQTARQATDGPWIAEVSGETGRCVIPVDAQSTREYVARTQLYAAVFDAEHIARHDPARILADIDAKRQIIDKCEPPLVDVTGPEDTDRQFIPGEGPAWGEPVLRLLALTYADHPDYRDEWRP